ncbi:MAG: hypothetical protein OJF51_000630 [Nitrospira sp.]|nr:MAG: hypothetical protein OJF51_000630 [Nitrospira sp.]
MVADLTTRGSTGFLVQLRHTLFRNALRKAKCLHEGRAVLVFIRYRKRHFIVRKNRSHCHVQFSAFRTVIARIGQGRCSVRRWPAASRKAM